MLNYCMTFLMQGIIIICVINPLHVIYFFYCFFPCICVMLINVLLVFCASVSSDINTNVLLLLLLLLLYISVYKCH